MKQSSKIADYLLQYGIKPSVQRMGVMGYLMEHRNHPTVDMIYEALSPEIRTLSRTTVYNALNLFREQGAVRLVTIDEKGTRYDINCEEHGHFKCLGCGGVFDVFKMQMPDMEAEEAGFPNFKIVERSVYYKGYCPDCVQKMS